MIKNIKYSSAIKDMPLLFSETRRTALLLHNGESQSEIIELSKSRNIYQLKKEKRRKYLPKKILIRLNSIDKLLIDIIAFGSDQNAKLITFFSIIKTDKLFFEFMREVYADKYLSGQMEISNKDFILFFEKKSMESERIAKWTKNNLENIRSTYKKILVEVGLGKKYGNNILIIISICENKIIQLIRKNNGIYADAMLLGVQ